MNIGSKTTIIFAFLLAIGLVGGSIGAVTAQQQNQDGEVSVSGSGAFPNIPLISLSGSGDVSLSVGGSQVDSQQITVTDGVQTTFDLTGDYTNSDSVSGVVNLGGQNSGQLDIQVNGNTVEASGDFSTFDVPLINFNRQANIQLTVDGQTTTDTITVSDGDSNSFSLSQTFSGNNFSNVEFSANIQGTADMTLNIDRGDVLPPVVQDYDGDGDGQINGNEARQGIRCFLFGNQCVNNQLDGQQVRELIRQFLFG